MVLDEIGSVIQLFLANLARPIYSRQRSKHLVLSWFYFPVFSFLFIDFNFLSKNDDII